jgi:transposase
MEGMSARDRDDKKLLANVTPNAEQTALLLAKLEANRRQEVETLARRLATDVELGRAVFAELARIDPGRFASLTKL